MVRTGLRKDCEKKKYLVETLKVKVVLKKKCLFSVTEDIL